MTNSMQVITGPTLRQFATLVENGELIVTSKLGSSTLSRVRFKKLQYPGSIGERTDFIKARVLQDFPVAATVLGGMFEQCISDQAKAVDTLLEV